MTRDEAKAAEKQIKGWSRRKKLALIRGDSGEISRLAKSKNGPSASSGKTGEVAVQIIVSEGLLKTLLTEAGRASPSETCGVLIGHGNRIDAILPARNIHPAPQTHFEIDPQTLIDAHRAARAGGPQVLGYYHSHPSGPAEPSATDRESAAGDGRIWAIVGASDVAFWRDGEGGFAKLSYTLDAR